jgi:hypothetical protein
MKINEDSNYTKNVPKIITFYISLEIFIAENDSFNIKILFY